MNPVILCKHTNSGSKSILNGMDIYMYMYKRTVPLQAKKKNKKEIEKKEKKRNKIEIEKNRYCDIIDNGRANKQTNNS